MSTKQECLRPNSSQMCTGSCTLLSVKRYGRNVLSIFRQPNKVICLQHHQTKSFSLSQPLFIYRFSKALCVSGNILFSKLAMLEMTGALEFRTPLPGQPKGHLTPITSDVMFTLFR